MKTLTAKQKDELDSIHDEIILFTDLIGQVSERSDDNVLILTHPATVALYRIMEKWNFAMGDLLVSIRDDEDQGNE